MYKIYYTFLLGIAMLSLSAQPNETIRCHTDAYMEQLLSDPAELLSYKKYRNTITTQIDQNKSINCTNTLFIPVAVHYSGSINNSNTTCLIDKALEQIDVLNEDFGGYNASISNYCTLSNSCCTTYPPDAIGQGTCIQFCLATMNHPSTTGLINTNYAITTGTYTFDSEAAPWKGYLNLFVSDISPIGTPSTLLGLAPVGGGMDPDGDGVFITARAFGGVGSGCTSGVSIDNDGTYNLGRTGTHEVGHYYGLNHVFFGNCSSGDGIADTPAQTTENYGCPTSNTSNCTSNAENSCGTEDFYFNFMDYVDDPCMYMFTDDQSEVMYSTALLAGNNGNEPYKNNATVCSSVPTYNPTYPNGCTGSGQVTASYTRIPTGSPITICQNANTISFTDTSVGCGVMNYSWSFSGAGVSPTSSNLANPTVSIGASGTLSVSLTASNATNGDTQSEMIAVNYLPASDPSCTSPCLISDTGPFVDLFNASSCFQSCPTLTPGFEVFTSESYLLSGLEAGTTYTIDFCNGYNAADWEAIITFASYNFANGSVGSSLANTAGCSLSFTPPAAGDYVIFVTEKDDCGGATKTIPNGLLTWATDCNTCPEADGAIFTDSSGENAFYLNNRDESFTICPDASDELVKIQFTAIDIEGTTGNCTDRLEVFYGSTTTGTPDHTLCGNTIAALDNDGLYEGKDYGVCVSFRFISDGNNNFNDGWIANVESCTTSLTNGVSDGKITFGPTNGGNPINVITVDNRCAVDGVLTGITSLQSSNGSLSKAACSANNTTLGNQVFYAIETNSDPNAQNLEIEVEDLSTAGAIDAVLYGPVTGTYPNFIGGTALACDDTPDANGLYQVAINNAGTSQVYILIIATENEGQFRFASTNNSSSLPVEISHFSVEKVGNSSAQLSWETQSEINNQGFEIERSTDGVQFENIAWVKAQNQTTQRQQYAYLDQEITTGYTYYYRLKQIDLNGASSYSKIVSLRWERDAKLILSPVPSSSELRVQFSDDIRSDEIELYDSMGRKLALLSTPTGDKEITYNVANLPEGVYYLVSISSTEKEIYKFIVVK